jgi:hypothetical protein
MSDKFKVVYFYQGDYVGAQTLEDWLNEQYKRGFEFVAVDGRNYIFKRNSYIKLVTKSEETKDESDAKNRS